MKFKLEIEISKNDLVVLKYVNSKQVIYTTCYNQFETSEDGVILEEISNDIRKSLTDMTNLGLLIDNWFEDIGMSMIFLTKIGEMIQNL